MGGGGGAVVRVEERGGVAGKVRQGGDYCSHWLQPEGVVLLSPCDAYRMFLICT